MNRPPAPMKALRLRRPHSRQTLRLPLALAALAVGCSPVELPRLDTLDSMGNTGGYDAATTAAGPVASDEPLQEAQEPSDDLTATDASVDFPPIAPEEVEPPTAPPPHVALKGRVLRVDGEPFHMRGVCYNPVNLSETQAQGPDFQGATPVDIPLMQNAHINTIRTYVPLTDRAVLDAFYAAGIYVINSVYVYGGDPPSAALDAVNAVKDHPAILMWALGNEWNYNGLYSGMPHDEALGRLNSLAASIKAADPNHPIATVYGELPTPATIAAMPAIDIWGLNAYRGLSFGNLFSDFTARTDKPYFLAEYGADAYNSLLPGPDPDSQAFAVTQLTQEIEDHAAAFHSDGTCTGGTLFEWSDEWWKDSNGSPATQDVGGIAPGAGPYPDATFNEEWWGIVDLYRSPRPALEALTEVFAAP